MYPSSGIAGCSYTGNSGGPTVIDTFICADDTAGTMKIIGTTNAARNRAMVRIPRLRINVPLGLFSLTTRLQAAAATHSARWFING
jgi:hypothetical protein